MAGFDHFTHLAPYYDRAIPFTALESLQKYGNFSGTEFVLDAAGGTGRVAIALKPYSGMIVVVDVSKGMLVQAAGKGLPVIQSPVEMLPFPDGAFERIVMIDAFHHVSSQIETAQELWRILAHGGILLIEEPDIRRFYMKLVAIFERIALMRSHFLFAVAIADLFRPYGANLTIEYEGFSSWIIIKKN
jgi:ubiquinone/menaquinone biosynthesis C-methylase UbiE